MFTSDDNFVFFKKDINLDNVDKAINSNIFINWKKKITSNFTVNKILIHNIFMFGSRVGFIIAEAIASFNNKPVPGITFLRGDSVSIMPILKCNGKEYTTIVSEPRIPVGKNNQEALPAGMVDNDTVACAALKELSEEIGTEFDLTEKNLINLGTFPLSAGGCDENIHLYAFEYEVDNKFLEKINNRQNGVETEHEQILVKIIELNDITKINGIDARSLLSYYIWRNK